MEAFDERLSLGLFPVFEEAKGGKGPKGQSFAAPELPGLDAETLKGFASRFEAWKGKLPGSDRSGAWKQSVDAAYLAPSTSTFENTERLREAYGLLGARGLPQTGAPVWRETYAYDARGNRLEKRNALGAIVYAYDAENRLEAAGARTYGYDANGSLVAETLSGLSVSYRYDAERRLVEASATDPLVLGKYRGASSTTDVAYAYDAFGRRNARTETGVAGKAVTTTAERTLYDGLSFDALAVYVDRDGRGAGRFGRPELAAEYLRANGVLVSSYTRLETKDGEWRPSPARGAERYYLADTLGSVRAVLDGMGHVEEVFSYDAYGSMYEGSPDSVSRFAYTGKPLDAATGRYDYGFRDYDPRTGRFQTVDPIKDGENWYGYVGNDPVNYMDIFGLQKPTVILSPGHGMLQKKGDGSLYESTGKRKAVNGYWEVSHIYNLTKYLEPALEERGFEVVNIKAPPYNAYEHTDKIRASNEIDAVVDAAIHIAVHADARGTDQKKDGVHVYYIDGAVRSKAIADHYVAALVAAGFKAEAVLDKLSAPKRLGELRDTTAPAVYFEIGNQQSATDLANMRNPDYMKRLAIAIADATVTLCKGASK